MASFPVPVSGYNKPRNLKNTPCSLHYNCLQMLQTPSFDTEFCRATSCDSVFVAILNYTETFEILSCHPGGVFIKHDSKF